VSSETILGPLKSITSIGRGAFDPCKCHHRHRGPSKPSFCRHDQPNYVDTPRSVGGLPTYPASPGATCEPPDPFPTLLLRISHIVVSETTHEGSQVSDIQAFTPESTNEALSEGIATGARIGVRIVRMPSDAKTSSNPTGRTLSRGRRR
jgi:hypothetical protein